MHTKHIIKYMKLFSGTGTRIRTFAAGTLFLVAIFILPMTTYAAGTGVPFFGPIIPDGTCAAGWGMVLEVVNRTISFLLTLAIVFVAPLMIAWAGFLFLTSGAAPSNREQARSILMNTVIGIVVALAGWIIVDEVMLAFYNADKVKKISWSQLITSGVESQCLVQSGTDGVLNQAPRADSGISTYRGPVLGTAPGPCPANKPACTTNTITSAANAISISLTSKQKEALSCIAMTESSGNPNTRDSSTGACGLFQITNKPGNWSIKKYHKAPCSTSSSCNNAACNLQSALLMFEDRGYQPWTGNLAGQRPWNPNAIACVKKYDAGANF